MGLLKRLTDLFAAPSKTSDASYWIYVQCNKCGEKIRSRVDMRNDISVEYGSTDSGTTYFTRKMIIGARRCYQPIQVEITFDHRRNPIDKKITGGKFITEEEYSDEG